MEIELIGTVELVAKMKALLQILEQGCRFFVLLSGIAYLHCTIAILRLILLVVYRLVGFGLSENDETTNVMNITNNYVG